jgi:hypothetical protein
MRPWRNTPRPPRDAAQRAATGRLDRAMYPQSLKPDQAAKLCVPLANKYGVPAPSRQLIDIVKARTSIHTLPLAARYKAKCPADQLFSNRSQPTHAGLAHRLRSLAGQLLGGEVRSCPFDDDAFLVVPVAQDRLTA